MYESIVPYIMLGSGADPTAARDITSITGDLIAFSNPYQLYDSYYECDPVAVYEKDGIPTATANHLVAPPLTRADAPPHVGIWSDGLSDASGNISFAFTITFGSQHSSAFAMTFDENVISGTVEYYQGTTLVATTPLATVDYFFVDATTRTYDKIVVTVTKIDENNAHVRLNEIDFAATRALSNADLNQEMTIIEEADLLQTSIPINEFDFSLLNTEGKYDPDNLDATGHNKDLEAVAVGEQLTLAFIKTENGVDTVEIMGRFIITAQDSDEEALHITAQDTRAVVQNKIFPITLSTSTPVASSISAMLTSFNVKHVIDTSAVSLVPDEDYTFSKDITALDQLLYIQQRYQIYVVPEWDGYLHIMLNAPSATATPLTQALMFSYPKPSQATTYNYISVSYGPEDNRLTYNLDLRTLLVDQVMSFTIDNPLVYTEAEAQALATRIQGMMFTQRYTADAIGDIEMEPYNNVTIEGRFSAGSPLTYRVQRIEYEYDGALSMTVEGVR